MLIASKIPGSKKFLVQSHDPSNQPSRHRKFTLVQSNLDLPNLTFTTLWKSQSHFDSSA